MMTASRVLLLGLLVSTILPSIVVCRVVTSDYEDNEDGDDGLVDVPVGEALGSSGNERPVKDSLKDYFDEEEFVGHDVLSKARSGTPSPPVVDVPPTAVLLTSENPVAVTKSYWQEYVAGCLLVVYLVGFFTGRSRNLALATAWLDANQEVLNNQFSRVDRLIQESYSEFTIYCTGRINTGCVKISLNLLHRQDVFYYMWELVMSEKDLLTVECQLDSMDPFIVSVLPAKREKAVRKDVADLKEFASLHRVPSLVSSLACLSDCDEAVEAILEEMVVSTLNKHSKYILTVHLTDQSPFSSVPTMLHSMYGFNAGVAEDVTATETLLKMSLHLVDAASQVALSKSAEARAHKMRLVAAEKKEKKTEGERQEAAQARREERIRKQLEEQKAAFERLSPAEQRAWEAKEERRRAAERLNARKKVVRA